MKINELGIKDYGRAIAKMAKGSMQDNLKVVQMYKQNYPDASPDQIRDMATKHIKALKGKKAQGAVSTAKKQITPKDVADQLEKESGKTIEPEKTGDSRFKTPPMGAVIKFKKSLDMKPIRWDGRQWTSMDGVVKHTQPGSSAEQQYHEIYFQGKAEGLF